MMLTEISYPSATQLRTDILHKRITEAIARHEMVVKTLHKHVAHVDKYLSAYTNQEDENNNELLKYKIKFEEQKETVLLK